MRAIFKKFFTQIGIEVRRKPSYTNHKIKSTTSAIALESMLAGLHRSKKRGVNPVTVIDVGAAQGDWTKMALTIWPQAHYVLFEPLQEREAILDKFAATHHNIHLVKAAAGDRPGTMPFFVTEDLDGSGIADKGSHADSRTIEVTTLDEEVRKLSLKGPFIIKLDTHGYEVPILNGTTKILKDTALIIVECYGFQITSNSLFFWEMCRLMQEKGFRLIDIVDVMRREKDMAFWQCDAFFIPSHSAIFNSNTYR